GWTVRYVGDTESSTRTVAASGNGRLTSPGVPNRPMSAVARSEGSVGYGSGPWPVPAPDLRAHPFAIQGWPLYWFCCVGASDGTGHGPVPFFYGPRKGG